MTWLSPQDAVVYAVGGSAVSRGGAPPWEYRGMPWGVPRYAVGGSAVCRGEAVVCRGYAVVLP